MKWFLRVAGGLLLLVGVVWFLQGINLLGGSFMSGQSQWAIAGAGSFVAGAVLTVLAVRTGKAEDR
jgi:hypothetical protein